MTNPRITILPAQAEKIAEVTAKTGAAVGLSQSGNILLLDLGRGSKLPINSKGEEIIEQKEQLRAEEDNQL